VLRIETSTISILVLICVEIVVLHLLKTKAGAVQRLITTDPTIMGLLDVRPEDLLPILIVILIVILIAVCSNSTLCISSTFLEMRKLE